MFSVIRFSLVIILGLSVGLAAAGPGDEPQRQEIPDACAYLSEELAEGLMGAERVRASGGNEHVPTFWSQCIYNAIGKPKRRAAFTLKFMVWDLFDVVTLAPERIEFNLRFVSGGLPVVGRVENPPGKATYVLQNRDLSALIMISAIRGPLDGAGRESELIATYQLEDPTITHEQRVDKLLEHARRHYEEWMGQAQTQAGAALTMLRAG